jgi:hypothetical protein
MGFCAGFSSIVGGCFNIMASAACYAFIGGGCGNSICGATQCGYDVIVGGKCNEIGCGNQSHGGFNAILGGACNKTRCNSCYNVIGGQSNDAGNGASAGNGYANAIFGSGNNAYGNYGFVAGLTNTINCHDYVAILGTYSKTSTATKTTFMCNVCAFGTLTKSSGTFKIDHPNPCKTSTHNLQHSFVESPTAGDNIYRFKIKIGDKLKGEITLPKYYKYLNTDSQVWVNPVDNLGRAFGVINSKDTKVNITTSEPGNYNVLVISTRKDKDATENWPGTETIKNSGELANYNQSLKKY